MPPDSAFTYGLINSADDPATGCGPRIIPSGRIRAVRQNQRIIAFDGRDPPLACSVYRQLVQVAAAARSRNSVSPSSTQYRVEATTGTSSASGQRSYWRWKSRKRARRPRGCAARSIDPARGSDCCCADSVGPASLLFADMIFKRDSTHAVLPTLSHISSRRPSFLMQLVTLHQAPSYARSLQCCAFRRRMGRKIAGHPMRMCRPSSLSPQAANCPTPASSLW